eukprot:403354271
MDYTKNDQSEQLIQEYLTVFEEFIVLLTYNDPDLEEMQKTSIDLNYQEIMNRNLLESTILMVMVYEKFKNSNFSKIFASLQTNEMIQFINFGLKECLNKSTQLLAHDQFRKQNPEVTSQLFKLQVILLKLYLKILKLGLYKPANIDSIFNPLGMNENFSTLSNETYWDEMPIGYIQTQKAKYYEKQLITMKNAFWKQFLDIGSIIYIQQKDSDLPKKAQICKWLISESSEELEQQHIQCQKTFFEAKYFKENQQDLEQGEALILCKWSPKLSPNANYEKKLSCWRRSLKKGMKLLVYDQQVWYPSFILDIENSIDAKGNQQTERVFIGYRIYHPRGVKSDCYGQFFGWSNRFDEWITIDSTRIRPMLVFEAAQGELSFVKFYLEEVDNNLNNIDLDLQNFQRQTELNQLYGLTGTPLYCACEAGRCDIAKYLLERNANLNIKKDELSPLMISIINDHPQIVELLIVYGADLKFESERLENQQILEKASQNVKEVINFYYSTERILKFLKVFYFTGKLSYEQKLNKNLFKMIITQYI